MTYDIDPTRWTDAPGAAPDVLRDAFAAACNEGPSDLQMRALSLKLAALSGGVVGATQVAAAAQASTTSAGGAVGAAGTSAMPLGKLAVAMALLGTVAGGSVAYWSTQRAEPNRVPAPIVQPAAPVEAPIVTPIAPVAPRERARESEARTAPARPEPLQPKRAEQAQPIDVAPSARSVEREPSERLSNGHEERRDRRRARSERPARAPLAAPAAARDDARTRQSASGARAERSGAPEAQAPEIELLRRARANLDARPRETYRLTQTHRESYPNGVFAQERDALAIEALLRSGEDKLARSHAEGFIEKYPSSPHAHRFRESMGIR